MLFRATPAALPVQQAFLNWDASMISAFLSTCHFLSLSLGNKHRFPFISITSTLQVRGGLTGTSLIRCKTLVLKVCCSHFSPREAGAPNILLTFSTSIRWVIRHSFYCKPVLAQLIWCFMPFVCPELCSDNLG